MWQVFVRWNKTSMTTAKPDYKYLNCFVHEVQAKRGRTSDISYTLYTVDSVTGNISADLNHSEV